MGHGSSFDFSSSYLKISRQLAYPGSILSACSSNLGFCFTALPGTGHYHQLGEIQPRSIATGCVSRCDPRFCVFQGFTLPAKTREAILNRRRVPVLRRAARFFLAHSLGSLVISDSSGARRPLENEIPPVASLLSLGSQG